MSTDTSTEGTETKMSGKKDKPKREEHPIWSLIPDAILNEFRDLGYRIDKRRPIKNRRPWIMIARVRFVGGRERVKFLNLDEKALSQWDVLDHAANAGVEEAIEDGELVLRGTNGSLAVLETGDERSVVPATYRFQPKSGKEYEVVIIFGEKDRVPGAALPLHASKLAEEEFTFRGPTRDVMEAVSFFPARRAIGWARKGEQRRKVTEWVAMTADGRPLILKEGFSPPKPWQPMDVELIEHGGLLFALPRAISEDEAEAAKGEITLRANVEADLEPDEYISYDGKKKIWATLTPLGFNGEMSLKAAKARMRTLLKDALHTDKDPEIKKWRDRGANPPQLLIDRNQELLLDVKAAFDRLVALIELRTERGGTNEPAAATDQNN